MAEQRVVLLGGTAGVGLAVAEAAAREGAVVTVAGRTKGKIDDALGKLPDSARGYQVDVSDEDSISSFFEQVGEFDHLVFTAGEPIVFKALGDVTMEEARNCFSIHFWGAYMAVKFGAPHIAPGGSIVLTSGIIAARPSPTVVASACATSAVESLTRAAAVELAPLRVNSVRLGPVESGAHEQNVPNAEELFRVIRAKLLTRRMGDPAEAAAAYLYLMQGGFTTGSVLPADGGYVLV